MECTTVADADMAINTNSGDFYYIETNPLLIDTVLYQLVHYFGLEDLKTLRLVNTSWNRAILPRFRKSCRVVFRPVSQEEVDELRLLVPQDETFQWPGLCTAQIRDGQKTSDISDRIASFTKLGRTSLDIFGHLPCSEFKLIDFPFESQVEIDFFHVCGSSISSLDVRINRKKGERTKLPETFGGDFYPSLFTKKVPNLRKLVLFPFPGLKNTEFSQSIPYLESLHFKEWASKELLYPHSFLESLFEKAVRLHEIWISIGLENCKSVENILIALATSGRYSLISKLHIAYLRLCHLEILLELSLQRRGRLRLKSFRIEALAHDVPTSMFETFIKSQSVNLEELYCRRFLGSSKFGKFTFPRMIGLRKLDCELSARQVMPLRCNIRFPKLQSLSLFGTCCQVFSFDRQFCGNKISETLTSLHFRPGLIFTGSILGLAEHFPCLKSLTLSIINVNELKQLLQSWETLEDLELYFGDGIAHIDSILTGISIQDCSSLLERLNSRGDDVEMFVNSQEEALCGNGISLRNFKNLKTLCLEYNAFLMSRNIEPVNRDDLRDEVIDHNTEGDTGNSNDADAIEDNIETTWDESYLPTDITGYFALSCMKSLRNISIPECQLTENCCRALIRTLELVSWKFCSEACDIVPSRKS